MADVERLLGDNLPVGAWTDGALAVSPGVRRGARALPLLLVAGVALVIALVPAGLRKVGSAIDTIHQAAND